MGKWDAMYQGLEAKGIDLAKQLKGAAWMNRFTPYLGNERGKMLDLGCGLGADMLRCAELGYEPYGLDLEKKAVDFVPGQYGFSTKHHDFSQPLPYDNETFSLVVSRFAVHYLAPTKAKEMFAEVKRVLKPKGKLLFLVNSKTQFELKLQYNYTDAKELEPDFWHLPKDKNRSFLFYTAERAKELVGDGWVWHHLKDEAFIHWDIEKRALTGLAEKC